MNRKGDKIIEIEKYLTNLEDYLPSDFETYMSDGKSRMACERCFEKIVEAVIDLVFVMIKENKFKSPDSDRDALNILSENDIISPELSGKLGDAKSMRNIIIHEYGNIDDRKIFDAIQNKLFYDVREFLEAINGK